MILYSFGTHLITSWHGSRNQLGFYTTLRTNPADQIFVYFTEEKSVGVKTMRK